MVEAGAVVSAALSRWVSGSVVVVVVRVSSRLAGARVQVRQPSWKVFKGGNLRAGVGVGVSFVGPGWRLMAQQKTPPSLGG